MRYRVRRYVDLVRMVAARFLEDRCTSVAASLTFTTLLSMVPLITVALTLIAAFPVFQNMMEHAKGFVLDNMVPQSVDVIAIYAEQFTENAGKLTAVGIAMLGATALLTLLMIDRVFNEIWRVPRARPLLQRVLVYWVLLTIGPLLIGASLSLTSWLVSLSLGWVNEVPGAALFVLKVVPIFLTSFAFALLYATMPNRPVRKRDAVLGGITAGIGFEIMKTGLSLYIAQFPTYTLVYGAFAAIPVFLIWIYLSWLLILCGAVVTAVLPEWRDRIHLRRPVPGTDFFGALAMLRALIEARASGTAPTLTELAGVAALTADRAERILDAMAALRWVTGTGGDRWVETRDAAAIRVGDVFRTFVLAPPADAGNDQDALRVLSVDLMRRLDDAMNITLEELFAGTRGAGGDGAKAPKVRAV